MLCFVYKSLKKEALYLFIEKKDDFSIVPEALLDSIGNPVFVMELELTPERKLAKEDMQQVMRQMQEKGFFVQLPPSIVPVSNKLQ
jgi:uncharacterized protein YcgL (UPF0745 family)